MGSIIERIKARRKTMKNMGFYLLASTIPMIFSLFTTPLYALYLSKTDFAITGYYGSFGTLFAPLILFYFNQYYMREYFFRPESERKQLKVMVFKSFIVFPFIIMSLCIFGLWVYMSFFNADSEMPFLPYAFLAFIPSTLCGIYNIELIDFKVQRQGKKYFWVSITNSILTVLLTILFVVALQWGAKGRMIGAAIPSIIMFSWAFYRNRDLLREKFDWGMFKNAVVFCAPLVLAAMLGFFSGGYDKVYLEKHVQIEELGLYSIGLSIVTYLGVFSSAINDTFNPDLYESLAKKDNRRAFKYLFLQIAIMTGVVLVFILFARVALMILTANRYVDAAPYARIASISAITSMIYGGISTYIISAKKTGIIMYTKILGSVVCVVSYNILISHFGVEGAAWGYAVSPLYFAFFALVIFWIARNKKDRTEFKTE